MRTKWTDAGEASTSVVYLYERYHRDVLRLALRYGGGRLGWAEDITHDVFVALLHKTPELSEPDQLQGYFYRVTTRTCLNRLRHERFVDSAPVRWLLAARRPSPETPETRALVQAELVAVGRILETLPPKQRVAACMRFIDDKSQQEIAEVMGCSKGYVSKLLDAASVRLKRAGLEVGDV